MDIPQEIIERIRRQYLIGVELPPEVEEGARNLRLNLNNALKTLSEDLYSKETHFVLELVQNADDNEYAPELDPEISFHLASARLLVENNELGFTKANVVALCQVGQSTKTKRAGFIGEKGIGFKSVFTATDHPEIHSNGFHFRFDCADPEQVLGYVVPHWCGDAGYPQGRTTIILPAKEGSHFTGEMLAELTDELLLFLRKVRTILITDETTGAKRLYNRTDDLGIVTLTSEAFESGSDVPTVSRRKFRYFRHTYPTTNIKEEKRQGVDEADVVLAFPITNDGVASADSTQNLFAFLPVRNYGFRFLIQGDFLLSSNREDVHKSPAWNKRVRNEVPKTFVSALSMLKTDPVLSRSFLQYVPRRGDVTDAFFTEAAEKIVEELKSTECMLAASGIWRRPKEVIIADEEFKALFPNDELKRILGVEYLSSEVQAPQATLERLGVLNASAQSHLLTLIEKDDRLAERPIDWLRALYRYCDKKVVSHQAIKTFQSLAATKLDDGNLAKLTDTEVYFPLQRGRRFGFEHELALLHPKLVGKGKGTDEIVSFFSRVGVKITEPYSLILHHILPKHTSGDWIDSDFSALVGHVAYVKEHISEYLKGAAAVGESADIALTKLRVGLYLQSKKITDGETHFAQAFEMYLGTEYRPTVPLERLLGAAGDAIKFVAAVYLSPSTGDSGDDDETADRRAWREFFHQLGVNQYPVVNDLGAGKDYCAGPELTALLTSDDSKIRKSMIEILDRHWTHYYSRFLEARSTPRRGYTTASASQFLQLLRDTKAPTRKRGEFKLGETYRDIDYVRAVFGASAAYLDAQVTNTDFLDAVAVTHRVDAAACIKRLDQLRGAERVSTKDVKIIYRQLEHLFAKEKTLINNAFTEASRIYIPALCRWFNSDEVVWESSGKFMDGQCPPLEAAYSEYPTFFCRYLQVSRRPKESALIQALVKLKEYGEAHFERKSEAVKIYRLLARSFRDEQARDHGSEPAWLDSLRTEAVFLDHMDRLIAANDIYIGDDVRLTDAFNGHEHISLLDVDPSQIPPLQDLLAKCGMQTLSTVAKYVLTTVQEAALDIEATQRIRQRSSHLMRVVYARAPGVFERANRRGLWKTLKSMEVKTVAVLEVEAEISGYSVRVPTDHYLHGHIIYLQAGARLKYDIVAQELCLYLSAKPDDLSPNVYRVLTASGEDELEDFFVFQSVPEIPHDELVDLLESEQESPSPEPQTSPEHHVEDPQDVGEDIMPADVAKAPAEDSTMPVRSSTRTDGSTASLPISTAAELPTAGTSGSAVSHDTSRSPQVPRRREPDRRSSGRLLSYAEPPSPSEREPANDISHEERLSIAKAAVDYVLVLERKERHDVVEMPFTNEGFDIKRVSEGLEEYIEVKGLSGTWGAEGVVVTPPEQRMAQRQRERFWLYVVEYAKEPSQRRLYKIQDPYGKIDQFRFDFGWKSVVTEASEVVAPANGRRVTIEGLGDGTIVSVTEGGTLRRLSIRMDSGKEVTQTYDSTKMSVSEV